MWCVWLAYAKHRLKMATGNATCFFGSVALWLDGRTIWVLGFVALWNVWYGQWRRTGLLLGGWTLAVILEELVLAQYGIELKGLVEQLELQRSFLFRDDLKLAFSVPENVDSIVNLCSQSGQKLTSWNGGCTVQMWLGNLQVWLGHGLLPPIWMMVFSVLGIGILQDRRIVLLVTLLLVPLCMSGLVWQPPRYLFWTLGGWVMCMGIAGNAFLDSQSFAGCRFLMDSD